MGQIGRQEISKYIKGLGCSPSVEYVFIMLKDLGSIPNAHTQKATIGPQPIHGGRCEGDGAKNFTPHPKDHQFKHKTQ
jgi:hypothetical protein